MQSLRSNRRNTRSIICSVKTRTGPNACSLTKHLKPSQQSEELQMNIICVLRYRFRHINEASSHNKWDDLTLFRQTQKMKNANPHLSDSPESLAMIVSDKLAFACRKLFCCRFICDISFRRLSSAICFRLSRSLFWARSTPFNKQQIPKIRNKIFHAFAPGSVWFGGSTRRVGCFRRTVLGKLGTAKRRSFREPTTKKEFLSGSQNLSTNATLLGIGINLKKKVMGSINSFSRIWIGLYSLGIEVKGRLKKLSRMYWASSKLH